MKLKLCCPHCGQRLSNTGGTALGTKIIDRGCGRCQASFRITIECVSNTAARFIHKITWITMGREEATVPA